MHEVLSESIQWVNLPFTVLLGVILLYWVMVGIGLLDMNLFGDVDVHLDTDAHLDLEGHADLDAHVDAEAGDHPLVPGEPHLVGDKAGLDTESGGLLMQALAFLNVGQVPVMLVVSVLSLCLWLGSMIANHYFTGGAGLLALAFMVPNLVVSVVATRYITLPFKPIFRRLTRDRDDSLPIVGQRCTIVTSEATPEFGQAEIPTDGAPLLLNVRTLNGAMLTKGDVAVVVRVDQDRSLYFIAPLLQPTHPK